MKDFIVTNDIKDSMIIDVLKTAKDDRMLPVSCNEMIIRIKDYQNMGTAAAVVLNEETLAIGGVGRLHKGMGVAWMILNNKFLKYPKSLLKISRMIIEEGFCGLDLHRVQMDVDSTLSENCRFAIKLGFSLEGVMNKYGPNKEDYYRYVRIKE